MLWSRDDRDGVRRGTCPFRRIARREWKDRQRVSRMFRPGDTQHLRIYACTLSYVSDVVDALGYIFDSNEKKKEGERAVITFSYMCSSRLEPHRAVSGCRAHGDDARAWRLLRISSVLPRRTADDEPRPRWMDRRVSDGRSSNGHCSASA